MQILTDISPPLRIAVISLVAVIAHIGVKLLRWLSQWVLGMNIAMGERSEETFVRRFPKFATVTTIVVSAVTFLIYFLAVGLILRELNISLQAYLASATVIGLAVGFGLQGFVQDIVIGLTLIFSDAVNIGDLVETSGQIGRVDSIGLRFTKLINLHDQQIYVPNRNINLIGRYRRTGIFVTVHVQVPDNSAQDDILPLIKKVTHGTYQQSKHVMLRQPEVSGILQNRTGGWRYIAIRFRLWPGQVALIETTMKQRLLSVLKEQNPEFADWMISVNQGVESTKKGS